MPVNVSTAKNASKMHPDLHCGRHRGKGRFSVALDLVRTRRIAVLNRSRSELVLRRKPKASRRSWISESPISVGFSEGRKSESCGSYSLV